MHHADAVEVAQPLDDLSDIRLPSLQRERDVGVVIVIFCHVGVTPQASTGCWINECLEEYLAEVFGMCAHTLAQVVRDGEAVTQRRDKGASAVLRDIPEYV